MEKVLRDIGVKISDEGKIWELHENGTIYREVKIYVLHNRGGRYPIFTISRNGMQTNYYAHRIIAQHFIPNPENYKTVTILNGNPYNFSVNNLKWISEEERINKTLATREKNQIICSVCGTKHHKKSRCKVCKVKEVKQKRKENRLLKNKEVARKRIGHVDLSLLKSRYRNIATVYLNGLSMNEIAKKDHTTRQNISLYLLSIERGDEKIFEKKFQENQDYRDLAIFGYRRREKNENK